MNRLNHKIFLIAIFEYLNYYYDAGYEGLGGFLGSLNPAYEDGSSMDPALYKDWLDVINKKENLEIEEAYNYMIKFLEIQINMGWPEISDFIYKENLNGDLKKNSAVQLARWNEAVARASKYAITY